jgi:hypothetical protein
MTEYKALPWRQLIIICICRIAGKFHNFFGHVHFDSQLHNANHSAYNNPITMQFFMINITEPICFTIIFPYVVFLVRDLGVPEEQAGYSVGWIASSFAFAQFCTGKLLKKRKYVAIC